MSDVPNASAEPLYAYLDTNALLEFRPPRDLDWNELVGEKQVVLVVSPVVIEELQRIKDGALRDMPRRKRQRAGEILKSLERDLFPDDAEPASIVRLNDRVGIKFDGRAVANAVYADNALDPKVDDARLVAAMIAGREAGQRVCLVANDAGARWQAKSRGIKAFDLPDEWRVKDEPDAAEAELRDAKKKLAAFESRAPKLTLRTRAGDKFIRHELPMPRLPLAEQVDGYMDLLRFSYAHYGEGIAAQMGGFARAVFAPPASGEVERYNKRVDAFLEKAEKALPEIIAFSNELDLYIPFGGIVVANDGTQPAEKVRLVLRPPPNVTIMLARPTDERPRFPDPPEGPKSIFDAIGTAAAFADFRTSVIPSVRFRAPPISLNPEWEMKDAEASISIGTLRHHDVDGLPPIWLKVASHDGDGGFSLEYELHAYNLPKPVTERFHVEIARSSRMRRLDLETWNDKAFANDDDDQAEDEQEE